MAVKLRPLNQRVVVRPFAAEEKTAGGLHIPHQAQEKTADGIVHAVWVPREWHDNGPDVEVGDHVMYAKHAGTEFAIEGVQYLFIYESDLQGVVDEAVS